VHAEVYGLGFDYIEKYPQYVRAVTVDDISRVARNYLDSENYTLVVVGPVGEDGNLINGTK
jgi:predicted Zn-dependent peptidase